ncbi:hypothetical protein F3Y22_tig00110221pilonHSYRG00225 [Hibiscus syriacus]|uniref:Uncharacterized protein n=1 Tax=Hibiscus syriacus TaxID=106335 RepID=A0A6A3BBB7_HIBSY|nr:hypothetical protein F3Y22_tig00110221pilonHSYRG00225 [Hibiscus syriacus]
MRPIKARSKRRPRRRGIAKEENEGETRKKERETGKEKQKSAEYSRRKRKVGRIGLKSVWRKSEMEASMVIKGLSKCGGDGVVVFVEPIGSGQSGNGGGRGEYGVNSEQSLRLKREGFI